MTNFGDFIKKVFNVGKRKSEQIEMDFGAPLTTYQTIKSASLDHLFTSRACGNIMEFLPDVPKENADILPEQRDSLLKSLGIVRGLYLRNRKESDDVIFWLNQYMKECSKHGKASEEEGQ